MVARPEMDLVFAPDTLELSSAPILEVHDCGEALHKEAAGQPTVLGGIHLQKEVELKSHED